MTPTTIELPDDLREQAQILANTTGRTLEAVLTEAVAEGLAQERWLRAAVEEGRRSLEHAQPIPADQVWGDFVQRGLLTLPGQPPPWLPAGESS